MDVDREAYERVKAALEEGKRIAVFQNHDLGSSSCGEEKALIVDDDDEFLPGQRMPDTPRSINWAYTFDRWASLDDFVVIEPPTPEFRGRNNARVDDPDDTVQAFLYAECAKLALIPNMSDVRAAMARVGNRHYPVTFYTRNDDDGRKLRFLTFHGKAQPTRGREWLYHDDQSWYLCSYHTEQEWWTYLVVDEAALMALEDVWDPHPRRRISVKEVE